MIESFLPTMFLLHREYFKYLQKSETYTITSPFFLQHLIFHILYYVVNDSKNKIMQRNKRHYFLVMSNILTKKFF